MIDNAEEILTEDMIKEFHKLLKEGTADSRKEWFKVGEYKKLLMKQEVQKLHCQNMSKEI